MKKKRAPAFRALCLRLGAFALALWLLAMGLLTWAVATDMQSQLKSQLHSTLYTDNSEQYPEPINLLRRLGRPYSTVHIQNDLPLLNSKWQNITSTDRRWGDWQLVYGYEIAEIYSSTDDPNRVLAQTVSHISFAYTTQEGWDSQTVQSGQYGYIILPDSMKTRIGSLPSGLLATAHLEVLRMTGWFEGCRFHPTLIEAGTVLPDFQSVQPDQAQLMALDSRGLIYWDVLHTQEAPQGQALETIYCLELDGYVSPLQPLTVNGTEYTDLAALSLSGNFKDSNNLFCSYYRLSDRITLGEQTYHYTIVARYWPLQYAFFRLLSTYLVTAIVVLLCMYLLRWILRRRLIKPLEQLVEFGVADTDGVWAEPYELNRQLTESRKALAEAKTELKQTQTALEYAQNAEEHRKMLISSIAHELKTPLAVIHSYAEGLQEGIAPDRQAHYLSVILSETERMDEMVLQMLDLSRLEAGKVRLTTEEVDLLALTEGVVKKLAPLWEAKELTIHYPLAAPLRVMADEARMEQVLTNLIGNAVKYSPPGSQIRIKLFRHDRTAHFRIQNQAPHLSEEARQKVWDSFYRADPSRTEPGTGLGLALVKRIIDLHRGSCSVQNTRLSSDADAPTALEFGFTLPVS